MSFETETVSNPLDLVEQVITANEWAFDRRSDAEMAAEAPDLKAPEKRRAALYELLAKANEKLWIGHFGLDEEDGMPIYRHSVLLRGAPSASAESIEDMVDIAITECERFFPAFQFVLWGGKSPEDALAAAMLECVGEA
jgi:hypothetical protein